MLPIPKRVLVVGAGPTGLVCLRNLVSRGNFDHVELWERRDDVGGVWYLDDVKNQPSSSPRWPSPAYEGLIGDVHPSLLCFSEFPFPEVPTAPHQPFPSVIDTHAYLRSFAEPYLTDGKIKLSREVVKVLEQEQGKIGWSVTYRDWKNDGKVVDEVWDAVIVAVGWYDTPVWPDTEGIEELKKVGLAKHAKWYRGPQGYEGRKILIIGNANSSNDMAVQLSSISDGPVYQSIRRPQYRGFPALPNERIKMVAPVSRYTYTPNGNKFDVQLTDGTVLTDLDYVHCGTGYRPLPDFIHVLDEQGKPVPLTSDEVVPWRVPMLHRFTMYAHNPSLAFIGVPYVYTPFAVADVVSTWLALAWMGETTYPDTPEERLAYERERISIIAKRRAEETNPTSLLSFSVMSWPEELEYAGGFREEVVKARPDLDKSLPMWDDERSLAREAIVTMKYRALEDAQDHPKQGSV